MPRKSDAIVNLMNHVSDHIEKGQRNAQLDELAGRIAVMQPREQQHHEDDGTRGHHETPISVRVDGNGLTY